MRSAEPQVSEVLPVQGLLHWVCGTDVMVLFSVEKKSEKGNQSVWFFIRSSARVRRGLTYDVNPVPQ